MNTEFARDQHAFRFASRAAGRPISLSTAPVQLRCKRARHERTKCTAVAAASVCGSSAVVALQLHFAMRFIPAFRSTSPLADRRPKPVYRSQAGMRTRIHSSDQRRVRVDLGTRELGKGRQTGKLDLMSAPVDIELIKGRQRAEDMRRLQAGEVTPEELQRENSFIWSAADILYVDLTPKGTEESWARIIQNLRQNSDSI